MEDLISRKALYAALDAIKAEKGKLYQNDYRQAIDEAPEVKVKEGSSSAMNCAWVKVTDRLPVKDCETFVRVLRPFSAVPVVMVAAYKAEGLYNCGRNKWSCEPVVGVNAGCKVLEWLQLSGEVE